ncbi:MAG: dienelactone hydrolase family protein [Cyanobacteria bacterium P01_F01_bin.150]
MVQGKAEQRPLALSARIHSARICSTLMALSLAPIIGLAPLISLTPSAAIASAPVSDRPSSHHNAPEETHASALAPLYPSHTSSQPVWDNTRVAQLPDILWDLIPADVLPPGIIPDGEFLEFLQQTEELLQTVSDRRGQYALITASALASDNPRLLSWLSQLQDSPIGTMTIRGIELGDFAEQLTSTLTERDQVMEAIALQANQEAAAGPSIDFSPLPDLRAKGPLNVRTETINFEAELVENTTVESMVDIYAPIPGNSANLTSVDSALGQIEPAPVIVISHGVGGARGHFSELANHLASYGFFVIVPDHQPIDIFDDASNDSASQPQALTAQLTQLGERLFGKLNPAEFIQRPLTVSALLDEVDRLNQSDPMWMGRFDMENVGIIGHSLGGYTGLALAAGNLNRKQVKRICKDDGQLTANLSLVLQCQAEELPRRLPSLEDQRIKAVMSLNPIASAVLGEKQVDNIDVPVMIVAGSHDAIAPMLSEQLPTFSWLTTPHKYLVTMVPGGHASVNLSSAEQSGGLSQLVTGPTRSLGAEATQALSVAFMQTYLSSLSSGVSSSDFPDSSVLNSEFSERYLTSNYGQYLSNDNLEMHLIRESVSR